MSFFYDLWSLFVWVRPRKRTEEYFLLEVSLDCQGPGRQAMLLLAHAHCIQDNEDWIAIVLDVLQALAIEFDRLIFWSARFVFCKGVVKHLIPFFSTFLDGFEYSQGQLR